MPRSVARQKERARAVLKERGEIVAVSIDAFLEILNDGRSTRRGHNFDATQYESHRSVRNVLLLVAEILRSKKYRAPATSDAINYTEHDLPGIFRWLRDHTYPPERPDVRESRVYFITLSHMLVDDYFLNTETAAYRLLARCKYDRCGKWFIQRRDDQRYHEAHCRREHQDAGAADPARYSHVVRHSRR